MSEEDEQRPPGWSDDQPPPFQQSEDGWQPLPPQQPPPGPGAGQPPTPGNAWTPPPAAPKPGVIPLRPLLVGEIMTGAIDYVRREPRTVISISAMVGVVAAFVQLLVLAYTSTDLSTLPSDATEQIDPSQLVGILTSLAVLFGITAAVSAALQIFGTGMLTHVMGRSVIGQRTSVGEAWKLVRPQLLRLIAATLLVGLVGLVAVALPLVPGLLLMLAGQGLLGGILLGVGSVGALVLGVWVTFSLVLTTPALALEDLGPVRAMKRSWRLVRGAFWRTLGIVLVGTIVGQAVGSIAASPFSLIAGNGDLTTWSVFGLALAGLVSTLVALPFIAGVTALVYIDRRIRTENLATVLNAAATGSADGNESGR